MCRLVYFSNKQKLVPMLNYRKITSNQIVHDSLNRNTRTTPCAALKPYNPYDMVYQIKSMCSNGSCNCRHNGNQIPLLPFSTNKPSLQIIKPVRGLTFILQRKGKCYGYMQKLFNSQKNPQTIPIIAF